MKRFKAIVAGMAAMAAFAAPAFAQSANVTVGASVKDTSGGAVGTIEKVEGNLATLSTGNSKVNLPLTSFGGGPDGLVIAMTKAEVDAAASGAQAKAQADTAAAIAEGAAVNDKTGAPLGTIEKVEGEFATVATSTAKVRLPKTAFAKGPSGLMIGLSAAELDAATKAAGNGGQTARN
ncbi:hypothetical protein CLG96_15315 [Sphingomonas oleivorans]|uniref:PRC-barrel domain-containing protein n=1 Tax=Sphingomonas oleivorans TaxID=1735121 RepID=A0A2T5FV09_9SPHN|nr:hypothetical protein [Sphingomonas oleivorans]PTQ08562.1 hypothetical protein CLG96_15315 [Sphingomonas oleivorans]